MDDQQLDDGIRKKVALFRGESYEPSAFSDLRLRMENTSKPFLSRYKTELIVGSGLTLATILILVSQWLTTEASQEAFQNKIQAQEEKIATLQQEILHWKNVPRDTVRIIEKVENVYSNQYLLEKITTLETKISQMLQSKLYVAMAMEGQENVAGDIVDDSGRDILVTTSVPSARRVFGSNHKESKKAEPRKSQTSERTEPKLSAETLRDMEKHYHPGIAINVGPVFEATHSTIKGGKGNLNTGIGILADFILSPSLSLEGGLKYAHRDYTYDQPEEKNILLPATDRTLGNLKKAEIDFWLIEIPLTLKYRYPFSLKTHGLIGIGYSSFISHKQAFDYSYRYDNNNDVFINTVHESKDVKFYPASINISLGLSRKIKDQKLEMSMAFNKGINGIGLEKTRADFFSLRTVFWLPVK